MLVLRNWCRDLHNIIGATIPKVKVYMLINASNCISALEGNSS